MIAKQEMQIMPVDKLLRQNLTCSHGKYFPEWEKIFPVLVSEGISFAKIPIFAFPQSRPQKSAQLPNNK